MVTHGESLVPIIDASYSDTRTHHCRNTGRNIVLPARRMKENITAEVRWAKLTMLIELSTLERPLHFIQSSHQGPRSLDVSTKVMKKHDL